MTMKKYLLNMLLETEIMATATCIRLPNYNIYIYIYNINDRTFEINFDEN